MSRTHQTEIIEDLQNSNFRLLELTRVGAFHKVMLLRAISKLSDYDKCPTSKVKYASCDTCSKERSRIKKCWFLFFFGERSEKVKNINKSYKEIIKTHFTLNKKDKP